jgi:hypothetical protein
MRRLPLATTEIRDGFTPNRLTRSSATALLTATIFRYGSL